MKTSENGITLITTFEGCRLTAYKCVETELYYTIGYGHYGQDVSKGMTITKKRAIELLKSDIATFESKVNKYNNVYNFNQNQFDALVSFAYNVGNIDALTAKGTRTLEKIVECIPRYNKSSGKVLAGLTRRRAAEQKLFCTPIDTLKYYDKYTGNSTSIDIVFRAIGVAEKYLGSWTARKPIATANNISNYVGSSSDNINLINLAKKGKLKRV